MLEADEPVVVQNSPGATPRGRGGGTSTRTGGTMRLVDEEPDSDRLQSPRDAVHERPIGTPDRPAFDDIARTNVNNNNAQQNTPNASLTNRRRVGDNDEPPPQRNRSASTSPPPAGAGGNSPPPTNRAAEALQRELNRQRGRGGAAGRGRGGAQPRNRLARRGANNDDSDRSSGDEDNAGNANPANAAAGGDGNRNGASSAARPKKNRLSNGEILTRPHVVLQSHSLPDDTIAAIDPSANQPKNYYGSAYGDRGLNVGKPAMKQAITLDSDWKFPLFPGGCSVVACCQTRCEIVRLWGQYANADVEGSEKGAQGFCCKILGGHNVDGRNYRHPRVLVPLQNPASNASNPNYVGSGNGEFTMSHGDEEMQPTDRTSTPTTNYNNNSNNGRGSSSSSDSASSPSSSRRMLITMIVLDVLTLGIPCGPIYNGMGTAIFGCWSRWQIRRKYRIEGYGWQDAIVMCCFPGCALHQHRNEIEFNQILLSSFGSAREMM